MDDKRRQGHTTGGTGGHVLRLPTLPGAHRSARQAQGLAPRGLQQGGRQLQTLQDVR